MPVPYGCRRLWLWLWHGHGGGWSGRVHPGYRCPNGWGRPAPRPRTRSAAGGEVFGSGRVVRACGPAQWSGPV